MIQRNRSSLAALSLLAAVACMTLGVENAEAQVVIRGPYLQQPTSGSIIVRWRTDIATDSRVEFGETQGAPDTTVDDATVTTEHEVQLSGLSDATIYFYQVGSTTSTLAGGDAAHNFRTSPNTGTSEPTRIWALGDSGYPDPGTGALPIWIRDGDAVRDAYQAFNGGVESSDVFLLLGDNAYTLATDAEYQTDLFEQYPGYLRTVAPWATMGNHEGFVSDSVLETGDYFDVFTLPTAGEAGGVPSGTESYYSFDYGNIHFVGIDSEDSIEDANSAARDAMKAWLDADLAATTAEWIIAFWHKPPYSRGVLHNSDTEVSEVRMRQHINPILDAYGVDLILNGHSHTYERSFLLEGHYGLSGTLTPDMLVDDGLGDPTVGDPYEKPISGVAPNSGAVYVVAGSASEVRTLDAVHPAMAVALESLGSIIIDVDSNELTGTFLDDVGVVQDTFQIVKGFCPLTPQVGCGTAEKSRLVLADNANNLKDRLIWTWKRGNIDPADAGDPVLNEVPLGVCVYDANGLVYGVSPPTADPLLWRATKTTFIYKDKETSNNGLLVSKIKPRTDGKAVIVAKGKGENLGSPALPLVPPVTAQLHNDETDACWESEFLIGNVIRNDGAKFIAK